MSFKSIFITFAALLAAASAMPSYIAVPADQIAFVDLTALRARRVPRQALSPPPQLPQALYEDHYQPIPIQTYQQPTVALAPPPPPEAPARIQIQPQIQQQTHQQIQQQHEVPSPSQIAAAQYAERPPDFGEYVDFGAHTGDSGAFGWYADYPVNNHDDSNYKK